MLQKQQPRIYGLVIALLIGASTLSIAHADTLTVVASKDNTLIEDANGAVSNGGSASLYAGRTNTRGKRRALTAFNLSGIPAGATVTSVKLALFVSKSGDPSTRSMSLFRVTADWGEGSASGGGGGVSSTANDATWKHRFFSGTLWTNLGGDFTATSSASANVAGSGSYTWGSTSGLVADVQGWVDNPATNFGWILIGEEGVTHTARRFESRTATIVARRPTLTVEYQLPAKVSGTITLPNCSKAVALTFEFRPTDGSPKFKRTATTNTTGDYALTGLPRKNMNVWIKGTRWLAKVVAADTTNGAAIVSATLRSGDANNDNKCNIFDLGTLAEAFNTGPTDSNWNEECDFNCDDSVDIFDLASLAENFNQDGDL